MATYYRHKFGTILNENALDVCLGHIFEVRSGPCRDVRVTELCEVNGDVTIPELKRQHNDAHDPSDYRPADEDRTVLESCARLSGK